MISTSIINQTSTLFGMFGTALLALDVAHPNILRTINKKLYSITKLRFPISLIFKNNLNRREQIYFNAIKMIGAISCGLMSALIYLLFNIPNDYINYILIYPAIILALFSLAPAIMRLHLKFGGVLISIAIIISAPALYSFSLISYLLSFTLKEFILFLHLGENKLYDPIQLPRVIGLLLIFISYTIQFMQNS